MDRDQASAAGKDQPAVTAAADISWSGPAGTFNLRVAAVITRRREGGSVEVTRRRRAVHSP